MFGKSGTNGADHTFVLNFDNGRNCLSLEDLNKDVDERIYLMTLG
jgi:hypothetical protein